jgi:putative ABC transport system ATP-binding protein
MTTFSAPHMPIVHLEDISLTLAGPAGPVNILKGIDLRLEAGETLAILGPSGSGKSTLLMAMGGLERAHGRRLDIAGRSLLDLGEDDLATVRRDLIGIVFQSFHLLPAMTAVENVAIPLELAGRADAFEQARRLLDRVGLGARVDHYPAQLSGGEQQRVAIARAMVGRPCLLLADEPTGNLDQANGRTIIDLMFALQAEAGTTLVLVTHDPALAESCGRILRLADGRIVE